VLGSAPDIADMIGVMTGQLGEGGAATRELTAIDEVQRFLRDSRRCPACAAALTGNRCQVCGVDLSGPQAGQVWQLGQRVVQTLDDREVVLARMRQQAAPVSASLRTPKAPLVAASSGTTSAPLVAPSTGTPNVPLDTPAATAPAPAGPPAATLATSTGAPWPSPAGTLPPRPPAGPRPPNTSSPQPFPSVDGLGVHGVLVGIGALLLAVAAVGFLLFSWRGLPLAGRATVIAIATVGVLSVASWLRSQLPQTAEAVGGLAVVLVLSDGWAIRRTGLWGADRPDGLAYAAATVAISAVLLGGWALISKVRAGSVAAAGLLPLAVVLLAFQLDGGTGAVPVVPLGFVLAAALTLARAILPAAWDLERWVLRSAAAGALLAAAVSAALSLPGPARAAFVLVAVALCAAAQAMADRRPDQRADQNQAGPERPSAAASWALALRRAWSLAAGLAIGTAAFQAGVALVQDWNLDGVRELLPLTVLPTLALLATAVLPKRRGAAVRRTALSSGAAVVALLAAVPLAGLGAWLPLRVALSAADPWSATPGSRLADLGLEDGADTVAWIVVLTGLVAVAAGWLIAVRIGGWPRWLHRPLSRIGRTAAGLAALVLPLIPAAPIAIVVAGLLAVCVLSALLIEVAAAPRFESAIAPLRLSLDRRARAAIWLVSVLTGALAVVLAWTTRELSVPLTMLGSTGLLLARRRTPRPAGTLLAALAATAALITVAAATALAGASDSFQLVWAGLAGGLLTAALFGLPRWWPAARSGRAVWGGADRFAAAVPGLLALLLGWSSTVSPVDWSDQSTGLSTGLSFNQAADQPFWPRVLLLAVVLLVALVAAVAVRPDLARRVPLVPLTGAFALSPVLGLLADATLRLAQPDARINPLTWAITTGLAAALLTALVLAGRTPPDRRIAVEAGLLLAGFVALSRTDGLDSLWPVLLILGAGAAAIASAPDRREVGWLSGVLLTGSSWARLMDSGVHTVEAYSLPPALVLLALAAYRLRKHPGTDPASLLGPVAALALSPSLLAVLVGSLDGVDGVGGTAVRPALLLVTAAALVLGGLSRHRRGRQPRLAAVLTTIGAILAAATAAVRSGPALLEGANSAHGVSLSAVELWTGPAAIVVLLAGIRLIFVLNSSAANRPGIGTVPSWPAYAPGLVLLLGPSLLAGMLDSGVGQPRQFGLLAVAGATLVLGSLRRLQAPVILGAAALAVQAIVLLAPWITVLPTAIPVWGWLAAIGLGLLLLGAGYERRLRQLRSLRLRLAALG
jgi:hypothetical protein